MSWLIGIDVGGTFTDFILSGAGEDVEVRLDDIITIEPQA